MFVAGVIVGTMVGGALGVVAVSLASMSRSADDLAEREAWARRDEADGRVASRAS